MKFINVQGANVPVVGLGTWMLQGRDCQRIVERAVALGYRHIDTAQAYGNEAEIGAALKQGAPRDTVWLTTKLWTNNHGYDQVLRSTEASLKRLQTNYIDLLLIHWPNTSVPLEETLKAMRKLQKDRAVRFIGVSNFTPSLLRQALKLAPIFCTQVEYHPYLGQQRIRQILSHQKDLMLTAYSPLARGLVNNDPILKAIAHRHGKTPAHVALRWLLQQDRIAVIPKAASDEHLRDNLDVFDFELNNEEMARIFTLERGHRLIDPGYPGE